MRNLTIKRTKSFVGCFAKVKIYIQDATSSELLINNIPCRKLGDLKNGEEKTFLIDENETKIFVIADKISKDYCNEFYTINAGAEDIYLTGRPHFNLANGNAFRFDGVANEEVLQNRKKGSKKGIVVLCVAIIGGFIIGSSITGIFTFSSQLFDFIKAEEPKTFFTDNMQITLTNKFSETDMEGFTSCYDSSDIAVFALKESFSTLEGINSLEEYGNLIIEANDLTDIATLQTHEDLLFFEYVSDNTQNKEPYYFFAVVYKSHDAFWLIQFATAEEKADKYISSFLEWAKTVKFQNS